MVRRFENTNYWALILGGSSGLGLASAKKLASEGMNICIIHRSSRTEMETINQEFSLIKNENIQFLSLNKDVLNPQHQKDVLTELKTALGSEAKIRCLLHSIAKGNLKPMTGLENESLSTDDFAITLQAMATSLYDWTKLIFNENLFAEDARVLAFTSEGSSKPINNYGAVSAAKAALEAISRNIALEFAPFGLRSNCIQAGVTDTRSLQMIPGSEEIKKITKKRNPFKRLTKPEDVGNVVSLLCQDEASWINGCVIPVDGGEHLS
ncbi:enoyl-ACP reductase FabI [Kaistella jeonii]|uniref:Short-chain dehydrogenase n=1 Tax=Kaistella jeonii TaxID=266749 RepID=A0A0C1FRQ1_9FLAO|nr:SDR family oxidoreductase [Kaistella jeonii]KIA90574.1 short-chain dehydrogenase [Kaistella jeonii]SFB70643.1 enoyl-[acyl-carrier protein] reductase I [Kaistella jeonii]VEI94832.1 Enoyl-[acyl-carrier-protein] reductase [NADPH] FabL [Kaistella jeonii]